MGFVHLHLHTEYSVLDGAIRCDELARHVKELGMPAVAITDHGSLHGVITFYKACREEGVKPIIGTEAYVTYDKDGQDKKNRDNLHMVLLAKNQQGYQDLLRLTTQANKRNFYYKPRICVEHLNECSKNVIALTACLGGPIAKAFGEEMDSDAATSRFKELHSIFGENFYAEIQQNELPLQDPYNHFLIGLAREEGVPIVATTDAHFLKKDDYELHRMMMAMQFRKTIHQYDEGNVMKYGPDYYVKGLEEMEDIASFYGVPEAIENTLKIAEQCEVEIELGKLCPPLFDITKTRDYEDFLKWKDERSQNE